MPSASESSINPNSLLANLTTFFSTQFRQCQVDEIYSTTRNIKQVNLRT